MFRCTQSVEMLNATDWLASASKRAASTNCFEAESLNWLISAAPKREPGSGQQFLLKHCFSSFFTTRWNLHQKIAKPLRPSVNPSWAYFEKRRFFTIGNSVNFHQVAKVPLSQLLCAPRTVENHYNMTLTRSVRSMNCSVRSMNCSPRVVIGIWSPEIGRPHHFASLSNIGRQIPIRSPRKCPKLWEPAPYSSR